MRDLNLKMWFKLLVMTVYGREFYYSHTENEVAKELLNFLLKHPAWKVGRSWESVFDIYLHGIEEWENLWNEPEKPRTLANELVEYMKVLAYQDFST
jgi:hypothetical protein